MTTTTDIVAKLWSLCHVLRDDGATYNEYVTELTFARMQERRKITLIDLERLAELWTEFYPKLDDLARNRLRLTPIYFLTPRG